MVNEDFYLNNKLVSVHLYYMEDYNSYKWANEYEAVGIWCNKIKKLKEYGWIWQHPVFTSLEDVTIYKTDEELLEDINPVGFKKYIIRNKKLYKAPKVVFHYVNGDERTKVFELNSQAEAYYNSIKNQYDNSEYITFN